MDFAVDEDTRALLSSLSRFVETELRPLEQAIEDDSTRADEILAPARCKSIELGFFAMHVPEEFGGGGLSTVQMCLAEEIIGRTSPVLSRKVFGHVHGSLRACSPEQRPDYLEAVVRGDKVACFCLTETEAGSDATRIRTTAVADGDGYVLNGTKHFITDGDIADFAVVLAVTDREKGAKGGITAFLVDKGSPGFAAGKKQHMMGQHGIHHTDFVLEDVRVGKDKVLGPVGEGFKIAMQGVAGVRLGLIGARSIGQAARMLEMAVDYARQRVQFGRPIGEFQMVQQMLADMAADIYAARMMVLNTAWALDQGLPARDKVSLVKLYSSEMVNRVADRTVQIFGGMGVSRDLPVERFYRDARVARIYDGTSEIHRGRIAKVMLKEGVAALDIL